MRRYESVMFVPDGVNGETMVGGNGALGGDDMGSRDDVAWLV